MSNAKNEIRVTPPRWEGEIKWQDLNEIVWGFLEPSSEFVRRLAYELLPEDKRP